MSRLVWVLIAALAVAALVALGWYAVIRSVERPEHTVVKAAGAFEIRDYPALVAAEVVRSGAREHAVRQGFGPLATYIFAKARGGEKIAMTAPVTQIPEADETWRVRFIMPGRYVRGDLPTPAQDDVRLVELPAQRVAAVRFSGRADDAMFDERTAALRAWAAEQGYAASGPPTLAYYDDPLVPGPLRHNEVLLPIEPAEAPSR